MCGSVLVYKTYSASHKLIYMSKGQQKVHSYCIYLSFWFIETDSDIGITSFHLIIEIHKFLTTYSYIILNMFFNRIFILSKIEI